MEPKSNEHRKKPKECKQGTKATTRRIPITKSFETWLYIAPFILFYSKGIFLQSPQPGHRSGAHSSAEQNQPVS